MQQLDLFSEPRGKRRLTPVFKGNPLHPDLRREHFKAIAPTLSGKRLEIYTALSTHGPCTCRELARRIGWEVTSVRPRITELAKAGKAKKTGVRRDDEYEFEAV